MAKPEDDNEKYESERDIAVIKKHIQRRLSQTTKKIQVLQPTSRWEDVSWLRCMRTAWCMWLVGRPGSFLSAQKGVMALQSFPGPS